MINSGSTSYNFPVSPDPGAEPHADCRLAVTLDGDDGDNDEDDKDDVGGAEFDFFLWPSCWPSNPNLIFAFLVLTLSSDDSDDDKGVVDNDDVDGKGDVDDG